MDRLRQVVEYIRVRLAELTLSQRAAIALCAALVAVSLLWLLSWSSSPDMVPVITTELSYEELDAAEAALRQSGIDYEAAGTRLFVRSADRHNAVRVMHGAGALPEGALFDMAAVVTEQNPFQSPDARAYAQNYAKGNELAKIISTSPYVKSASVMINPKTRRRLGGDSDVPTASVTVMLASSVEMTGEMVEGFAKLVSGAVAGLKPHNVFIQDARSLRSYNVPSPDDAISFDYLQLVKAREEHLREKILNKLADIPGVQVAVAVEIDTSKRVTQRVRHDKAEPKLEKSHSNSSNSRSGATEPGVQANLGQAVTAGAEGSTSTQEETTVENFEPKLAETETVEHMPYATKSATATIGIPRSFVAGIYSARFPDKESPKDTDAEFVKVRDEQVQRVKSSVQRIVMAKSPDDVYVDVYPDMEWSNDGGTWRNAPGAIAAAQVGGDALDPMNLAVQYGPGVGLGVLALTSLMMMLRIAKSATPRTLDFEMPQPEETDSDQMLTVGPHAVGQAEISEGLLTGRELDDDTLRYQELTTEVSEMVEKDPEGAAGLLQRWVDDNI